MANRFESFDGAPDHFDDKVAVGSFLIATPGLEGTPFQRTVIFVLQHNEHGTFGVVLNRPADEKMRFAWHEMTGGSDEDPCIVQGGPIGGPIFAIHRDQSLSELEMPGGIHVSYGADKFSELLTLDQSACRIVFGVSAWQAGQLASELEAGKWFQIHVSPDHVFDDPFFMWENFLRYYGAQVLADVVGLRAFPENPLDN